MVCILLTGLSSTSYAQTVERIISLAPNLTELIFSAGAGDKLVGVLRYSNYPPEALSLANVGDFNALNLERIVELDPDLILAWASGNKPQDILRLKNMGFRVLVRETQELDDIPNMIEEIGQLTNRQTIAEAESARLRDQIDLLRSTYQNSTPVTVFYQVWHQPLITVNGEQFIGQAISLCGGVNVFADQDALAPHVSIEAVIKANPELILLGGMDEMHQAWLKNWQSMPFLTAHQNQQIMSLNADQYQRPTARLIDGLTRLCTIIDQTRQTNFERNLLNNH